MADNRIFNVYSTIVHVFNEDQKAMRLEQMQNFVNGLQAKFKYEFVVEHHSLGSVDVVSLSNRLKDGHISVFFNCHGTDQGLCDNVGKLVLPSKHLLSLNVCHGTDQGLCDNVGKLVLPSKHLLSLNVNTLKPEFTLYFISCAGDVYNSYNCGYGFQVDWKNVTWNVKRDDDTWCHQILNDLLEADIRKI
jgi:hypothetical protein